MTEEEYSRNGLGYSKYSKPFSLLQVITEVFLLSKSEVIMMGNPKALFCQPLNTQHEYNIPARCNGFYL